MIGQPKERSLQVMNIWTKNSNRTRKFSCVNARGIKPASSKYTLSCSSWGTPCPDLGPGWGYPHPADRRVQPSCWWRSTPILTWDGSTPLSWFGMEYPDLRWGTSHPDLGWLYLPPPHWQDRGTPTPPMCALTNWKQYLPHPSDAGGN